MLFRSVSQSRYARGGGSLKEQISWWSKSAIERPKITIQGEMVQRLFSTKEILNSQCSHLSDEANKRKIKKANIKISPALTNFAQHVENEYQSFISNTQQLQSLLEATPYKYLEVLRIGSRPTKRMAKEFSIRSLRAIPWILCWTQTRSLIPIWWGIS